MGGTCGTGTQSEGGEWGGVRRRSPQDTGQWGLCTLGTNALPFPHLPVHTQQEGPKGGSVEVPPSPQAQRDTGHSALRDHSHSTRCLLHDRAKE